MVHRWLPAAAAAPAAAGGGPQRLAQILQAAALPAGGCRRLPPWHRRTAGLWRAQRVGEEEGVGPEGGGAAGVLEAAGLPRQRRHLPACGPEQCQRQQVGHRIGRHDAQRTLAPVGQHHSPGWCAGLLGAAAGAALQRRQQLVGGQQGREHQKYVSTAGTLRGQPAAAGMCEC